MELLTQTHFNTEFPNTFTKIKRKTLFERFYDYFSKRIFGNQKNVCRI